MPDEPKGKVGKGITKKVGPLPLWGWIAVGGGVYVAYRFVKSRESASASTAASGLTGGTTIPTDTGQPAGLPTFNSLADWEQAAIATITNNSQLGTAGAFNGLQDWLNGGCVSQDQYNAISAALGSVGLPPGSGTSTPTLSVCPTETTTPPPADTTTPPPATTTTAPPPTGVNSTPQGPPNLPASIVAAMQGNGESLVDETFDSVNNEWLYLTNKGGLYTLSPSGSPTGNTFYGSYLSLPAEDRQGTRSFSKITVLPDGGYVLTASDGSQYKFGSQPGEYNATAAA